jgi:nucleotide-binding universal stress UspA family protein
MTGWAASKRLLRELRTGFSNKKLILLIGTIISALLTTFATLVIFEERFFEGAWSYFLLIPVFYAIFTHYRRRLGPPPSVEDRLGRIISGQGFTPQTVDEKIPEGGVFKKILIAFDSTTWSEQLLPMVRFLSLPKNTQVEFLLIGDAMSRADQLEYLRGITDRFIKEGFPAQFKIVQNDDPYLISQRAITTQADLILIPSGQISSLAKMQSNNSMVEVIKQTLIPTLIIKPLSKEAGIFSSFNRIVVALDGSEAAESVLIYLRTLARARGAMVYLLSVPEGSESENYATSIQLYLDKIAGLLQKDGIDVIVSVTGSGPARTILAIAESVNADLIVMASHGRAGIERPTIHIGSVTEKVLQKTVCPLFVVPLTKSGGH